MKTLLQHATFFCFGIVGTSTLAAEPGAKVAPLATDFSQISSLVVSLVFILCLILICAWLVKRVSGITHAGSQHLKVLGALSVGSKERALLITAGDTQLLLGVAAGSVSLLHVFDEPVVNAAELASENNFANTLKQMTGRKTAEVSARGNG